MNEKIVYICNTCEKRTDRTIFGQCDECSRERRSPWQGVDLATIQEMRSQYAHKMNEELKRIGKMALEGAQINLHPMHTKAYYDAQAKVSVLDELLEKIKNTPEDEGKTKDSSFCNEVIRDAEGNEIARAKGV